ncbi:MAG: hypothetical protein IT175_08875 [Acidobacteria bacterium]|nr:hypothetical protein [Acidobacteriota bacterium]
MVPSPTVKLPLSTCEAVVAAAQNALGGLDRLRGVRTFHVELLRSYADGIAAHVTVWRAAGGRVFIEERTSDGHVGRTSTSGALTDEDRSELIRAARLSPRNLLAHADEIELTMRDHLAPGGLHVVSYPAEFSIYFFDAVRHTCLLMIDLVRSRRVAYSDYRPVDGILTPHRERHQGADPSTCWDDRVLSVAYDLDPPPGLWE